MNKLVARHSSFGGRAAAVIRGTAAVVIALAATAASARTVSVASIKGGEATAAFGNADGAAYTLAWGYGPADGGSATNAWAHFETLGEVAASATSRSVALPAGWGDAITHLRFFLLGPKLPAGATRVEYLQSSQSKDSPTQWIDTDVPGKAGVEAEVDFMWTAGSDSTILGSRKDNGDTRFLALHWNGSKIGSAFTTWASFSTLSAAASSETRYLARASLANGAQSLSIDGTTKATSAISSSLDTGYDMYLFAANLYGSAKQGISAKIYSAKIWLDGELKRNFVPCRDAGNVPAMYDFVSGGYFHNGGSGSFTCGDPVGDPIAATSNTAPAADYGAPDAYLDYVEATGAQMVNTECLLASNSVIVAEYAYPNPIAGHNNYLFGVYKSGMTAGYFYSNGGSYPLRFQKANGSDGSTTTEAGINATPDARQTVTMRIASGATTTIASESGETLYSGVLGGIIQQDATAPLVLLGLNNQGNLDSGYACSAKIYSFRIYDGDGNLARHFLPCLKNGVAGFYDKVSGRTFRSATATALVAGPELPRPAELVKWVQSDGAGGSRGLYVDTGIPAKTGTGMTAELLWPAKPTADSTVCGAMADSTHHFTLYTSAGTHQIGYANYSAFQVNTGTSVVYGGKRYRITSSLAAKAQNIQVEDLDGTGYNGSRSHNDSNSIDAGNNLYLFARNDAGTPNQLSSVRLYSLVLTNDLGVVRDFIPCVADNGKAGLYDRVSERVFFPQAAVAAATPAFDFATEVGAATNSVGGITEAPASRLSYVESDGTSDFVDLGIEAKDGTKMVADLEWTVLPDDDVFCGARMATSGANSNTRFFLYNAYGNSPLHAMGYGSGNATVSDGAGYVSLGTRYRIETTLEDGAQTCAVKKLVDGAWSAASTRTAAFDGPMQLGIPLYLFARNLGGTADSFAGARVYSLKLWQKDGNGDYQLVRDLAPAKTTGGAVGLYDRVTAGWLFNSGDSYSLSGGGTESVWRDGFVIMVW